MRRTRPSELSQQVRQRSKMPSKEDEKPLDSRPFISTGCLVLDLAISGRVRRSGGVPGGIFMEIHGPSGSGKTVILCEMAGNVQRKGGQVMFKDPEARLNKNFSKLFGMKPDELEYDRPDTVTAAFSSVRKWGTELDDGEIVHGVFADSLAALSTDLEMENEEGDKMGMRRAKEFSEEFRKISRIIANKNILLACSNQLRINMNAGPYGQKYTTPGGKAIEFYPSLRLRCKQVEKLRKKVSIRGKEHTRVIGIETTIEVIKSSIDVPHREAVVPIIYDFGVDDVRSNLKFLKQGLGLKAYALEKQELHRSLDNAIEIVEKDSLEKQLRKEVIRLWQDLEDRFRSGRKPRHPHD